MGNCIRTEMWKAFHNKMMRSALLIGFILVIADLVQTAITVSDLGASYAHSPGGYDGCSLFVNWIGVNGVTVGAVVFYAVWPFLAAMPYGWSLYEDNRSHMTNNILTRVPYSQYLTAKMAAVFVSGTCPRSGGSGTRRGGISIPADGRGRQKTATSGQQAAPIPTATLIGRTC